MKEKTRAAVKAATEDLLVILDKVVINPATVAAIRKRMDELDTTIEALEPEEEKQETSN